MIHCSANELHLQKGFENLKGILLLHPSILPMDVNLASMHSRELPHDVKDEGPQDTSQKWTCMAIAAVMSIGSL